MEQFLITIGLITVYQHQNYLNILRTHKRKGILFILL